jgi:hypothetical protein
MGDFVIFLFDSAICVETVVNGSDFFRVKTHTHTHQIFAAESQSSAVRPDKHSSILVWAFGPAKNGASPNNVSSIKPRLWWLRRLLFPPPPLLADSSP